MFAPKIRKTLYQVGTIATALLSIFTVWNFLDPVTSSALNSALGALLGLLGVGAAGTAAVVTKKQIEEGQFDSAPEASPADVVANAVQSVLEAKQSAERELAKVQEAIAGTVSDIPVLGPLATQVLDQLKR